MGESAERWRTELVGAVIEASPDPIVVFERDSTVRLWNQAAEDTFGYAREAVLGRRFTDLDVVPPDGLAAFEDRLRRSFEGERFDGVEAERHTKGGDRLHLSLSKAPVRNEEESVTGVVTVKKDISEQKRLEARLRAENQRLEEFSSVVSHDLRNPLSVAAANLELARQEDDGRYLDAVRDAHERMGALIDELLALALGGIGEDDLEPVALGGTAEEVWRFIETEHTTLTVRSETELMADRAGITRILDNLLGNAVEHGGEHVVVGALEDGAGFFVEDDGPGIPPDRRDDVFVEGYQTGQGGSGYGLTIVREVADAHGWEVGVAGGDAGGARFEVSGGTLDG